jgi:glycosyltransferase involved in cell wall biosynthesis
VGALSGRAPGENGATDQLEVTVGVMAHNEAATIGRCLRALREQILSSATITSVVVVASECSDATEDIVRLEAAEDPRIRLIVEVRRSGKASAINLFLAQTTEPICVVLGADLVVAPGALENLLAPLRNAGVGMTGGRPVPTNPRSGVIGHAVHILWELHHEVALRQPKLGEAIAFRRLFERLSETLTDEVSIEALVARRGMRLQYVPSAVIYNHGPENLRELWQQRSRIYLGHLLVARAVRYRASTMSLPTLARALGALLWRRPSDVRYIGLACALELGARTSAYLHFLVRRRQLRSTWRPIPSSKEVVASGHVLREFFDCSTRVQAIPLRSVTTLTNGHFSQAVRHLVRRDDRVNVRRGSVQIDVRAGRKGATSVAARLQQTLPGCILLTPNGEHHTVAHPADPLPMMKTVPNSALAERVLIVIPTYNERENVGPLLTRVRDAVPEADILVVDDGSPDGTGGLVAQLAQDDTRISLFQRREKLGLGSAYLAAFAKAAKHGYDLVVTMDADFSHDPTDLRQLLAACRACSADVVIGSRYIDGGKTVGWRLGRRLTSAAINRLARVAFGDVAYDWTAGFRVYRRDALDRVAGSEIRSQGFSIQEELLAHLVSQCGASVVEIPVEFRDRQRGNSKVNLSELRISAVALSRVLVKRFVDRTSWAGGDPIVRAGRH